MDLPKDFTTKMQSLLQGEFPDFLQSYTREPAQGLRVNTLKITVDDFKRINPFTLRQIPWAEEGFFYGGSDRPGKHPFHDAGLYYIQEPSAMAVGEIVAPEPGEKVLDLCAAPGGKTTHMAAKMNGEGLLVANEIHPARAKILSQNIERMGIRNAIVTNETPERLSNKFPGYFDRILVDAPCSGEGMFRKDPEARAEWSLEQVARCVIRQQDILEHAAKMLKAGGRLVYSTCTFSPEENEGVISSFIRSHPEFLIETADGYKGFSRGRKEWSGDTEADVEKTIRLWPHKLEGEGHFIAVLRKTDGEEITGRNITKPLKDKGILKDYYRFVKENLQMEPSGNFYLFGDHLYILPEEDISLKGLKVLRPGWHLGTLKKNRFEPSHALALSLTKKDAAFTWNLPAESAEMAAYLKGETLNGGEGKGWYLMLAQGYSIGWAKCANGLLKNHYPKGLRWKGM